MLPAGIHIIVVGAIHINSLRHHRRIISLASHIAADSILPSQDSLSTGISHHLFHQLPALFIIGGIETDLCVGNRLSVMGIQCGYFHTSVSQIQCQYLETGRYQKLVFRTDRASVRHNLKNIDSRFLGHFKFKDRICRKIGHVLRQFPPAGQRLQVKMPGRQLLPGIFFIGVLVDAMIHPGHFTQISGIQVQSKPGQIAEVYIQIDRVTGISASTGSHDEFGLQNLFTYILQFIDTSIGRITFQSLIAYLQCLGNATSLYSCT